MKQVNNSPNTPEQLSEQSYTIAGGVSYENAFLPSPETNGSGGDGSGLMGRLSGDDGSILNSNAPKRDIQSAMRNINWSRSYLWEVELEGAPFPFGKGHPFGFPAVEVDDTISVGDTFDWEAGLDFLRVPRRRSRIDIRLTFYDTEDGRLEIFFEDWFNKIYGGPGMNTDQKGAGVEFLDNSVKELTVRKLTSRRKFIYERRYNVFPNGTILGVNKSNDSGPRMYMIDLCVSKYLSRKT